MKIWKSSKLQKVKISQKRSTNHENTVQWLENRDGKRSQKESFILSGEPKNGENTPVPTYYKSLWTLNSSKKLKFLKKDRQKKFSREKSEMTDMFK